MDTLLSYTPDKWHGCGQETYKTCGKGVNCYAYALDRPDYYWAVPGMGFAHARAQAYFDSFNAYFADFSIPAFRDALKTGAARDGLVPVDAPDAKPGLYCTALFFPEDAQDFHWYRQDDSGLWSHKNGWRRASDRDADGHAITDPRQAAEPYYTVFGGFFLAPRAGIRLAADFPL